jgi:hypothetical protein
MSSKKSIENKIKLLDKNIDSYLYKQENKLVEQLSKYQTDLYTKLAKYNINIMNFRTSEKSELFVNNFITPKYHILDNFGYYKDLLVDLYAELFNYKYILNRLSSTNVNIDNELKNIKNFSLNLAELTVHMEDYADKKTKLLRKLTQ